MQLILGEVYYLFINLFNAYKLKEYYVLDDGIICPWDVWISNMEAYDDSLDELDYEEDVESEDFNSEELDDIDILNTLVDKYSLNVRTCYGLPITDKEYKSICDLTNVMYTLSGGRGFLFDNNNNIVKKKIKKQDIDFTSDSLYYLKFCLNAPKAYSSKTDDDTYCDALQRKEFMLTNLICE